MAITFQVKRHKLREVQVVEVFNGEKFVATLCEDERDPSALRLISGHVSALHAQTLPAAGQRVFVDYSFSFRLEH
jgi:hypothetical protein